MSPYKSKEGKSPQGDRRGVAGRIRMAVLNGQRALADWLTRKSERLSLRDKKISLLLFGILMGGVSLMLIVNSFRARSVDALIFPKAIDTPATSPRLRPDPVMTETEYRKLRYFRRLMDSLGQTPRGRALRDEILAGRTGLLDSIDFLLDMYE